MSECKDSEVKDSPFHGANGYCNRTNVVIFSLCLNSFKNRGPSLLFRSSLPIKIDSVPGEKNANRKLG